MTNIEDSRNYAQDSHLLWLGSPIDTISNHMRSKVWDEIIYPFSNFNGATVEVWEWITNFIGHFIMDVITYAISDWS